MNTWICTNDRYSANDVTRFDSVEEFEASVREAFPDEMDGFELRLGVEDGRLCYLDELDEVALTEVPDEG